MMSKEEMAKNILQRTEKLNILHEDIIKRCNEEISIRNKLIKNKIYMFIAGICLLTLSLKDVVGYLLLLLPIYTGILYWTISDDIRHVDTFFKVQQKIHRDILKGITDIANEDIRNLKSIK